MSISSADYPSSGREEKRKWIHRKMVGRAQSVLKNREDLERNRDCLHFLARSATHRSRARAKEGVGGGQIRSITHKAHFPPPGKTFQKDHLLHRPSSRCIYGGDGLLCKSWSNPIRSLSDKGLSLSILDFLCSNASQSLWKFDPSRVFRWKLSLLLAKPCFV